MTSLCAFNPPIWLDIDCDVRPIYQEWAMKRMIEMDMLNTEELQRKAYEFWVHLIRCSSIYRDPIWIRIDNAFLKYFHHKNELLFKDKVFNVKKSHKDKYTLSVNTKFGNIEHPFSSIRECRDSSGLELRNYLRKILYK